MLHGMKNFVNAVATRLIQNDQRNETQEGIMDGLYTALQNLAAATDKHSQGNQQMKQKYIATQQQMERMGRAAQVEFGKSINSVAR